MGDSEEFGPRAAVEEIQHRESGVRTRTRRWAVWYWSTLGTALGLFYVVNFLTDLGLWFPLGWLVGSTLLIGVQELRRDVVDPEQQRLHSQLMWTHFGLAAVVIVVHAFLVPDDYSAWAAPLGVIPAVPFFYGAWWALRR
jgi:hypothetical protein